MSETSQLLPFLKKLISAPGLSGYEGPIRDAIQAAWEPLVDEMHVSRLGSLNALRKGTASDPRPRVLFAAHMDAIGLMVTAIVDGFLRITEVGGLDHRVLPGQAVIVHGREDLPGVIVQPPAHLLPSGAGSGPVSLEHLLVDTGLSPDEVAQMVRLGDLVSFAQEPFEMGAEVVVGHSLDNRASVAALTHCLEILQSRDHLWDLWVSASAQEEETMGGALTSAFELRPDLAVAVDVTWAKGPGAPEHKTFSLGKGPTLGWGPNVHPGVYKSFKDLAERLEIPYHMEAMPRHSGTDAYAMQVAAEGIPTMVLGIPLRYMHTPVEVVAMKDIQRVGRLLAEFVADLTLETMDNLTWDS